mgnify:CR=1 FL=1
MPPVQDVAAFLAMRDQGLPLLDVRSPGEFALAHIPGALNLPLFTDEERARVGTAHARSGREGAVHLALELVGGHLAALLARARHLCGGKREVLLHCWRGGMRSDSMRWLLETGGFTVHRLEGGYKSYRTFVRGELARPRPILVLGGYTGCGKTDILLELQRLLRFGADADLRGLPSGFPLRPFGIAVCRLYGSLNSRTEWQSVVVPQQVNQQLRLLRLCAEGYLCRG